jgi:hypothetical protein
MKSVNCSKSLSDLMWIFKTWVLPFQEIVVITNTQGQKRILASILNKSHLNKMMFVIFLPILAKLESASLDNK